MFWFGRVCAILSGRLRMSGRMFTKQGNFIQRKAPYAVDSVVLFRPNGVHLTVFYLQVVVIAKKDLGLCGESGCL